MVEVAYRKEVPQISQMQPDYYDPKEPYAFFGLASYWSQCFEQSLILVIAGLQIANRRIANRIEIDELFENLDQKTLGKLIREVKSIISIEDDILTSFNDLLKKRNYLAHHFFVQNSTAWFREDSRRAMIEELRDIAQAFQNGDQIVVSWYSPLWGKLGITDARIEEELRQLRTGAIR